LYSYFSSKHEANMNHTIIVQESSIHNKGVFAARDIKKGEHITKYIGEKISRSEGTRRAEQNHEHAKTDSAAAGTYIFELKDGYDLDGDVPGNDAKYINHSCSPNCRIEIKENHIDIYAAKDIQKGEELSYNYGFEFTDEYSEYPCRCGSLNCVGYMIAEEDWPKLESALAAKDQ